MAGFRELYKSTEIKEALTEAGEAVAREAERLDKSVGGKDPLFATRTHEADRMAITNVFPANAEAARANYNDNTLLQAVGTLGLPTKKPRL